MIIGVPKEIKNNENRVALTPAGAAELVKRNNEVYVQATAGNGRFCRCGVCNSWGKNSAGN